MKTCLLENSFKFDFISHHLSFISQSQPVTLMSRLTFYAPFSRFRFFSLLVVIYDAASTSRVTRVVTLSRAHHSLLLLISTLSIPLQTPRFLRYAISVFSSTHIQHSEHVTRHARGHAIAYAIIGSSVRSYDFAFTISDQYLAITDGLDMLHEEYVSETSQVM